MKIIQIAVIPHSLGSIGSLVVLTDEGRMFEAMIRNGANLLEPSKGSVWKELPLIKEEQPKDMPETLLPPRPPDDQVGPGKIDLTAMAQIVARLHSLLQDPHPGLLTWYDALRAEMQNYSRCCTMEYELKQAASAALNEIYADFNVLDLNRVPKAQMERMSWVKKSLEDAIGVPLENRPKW